MEEGISESQVDVNKDSKFIDGQKYMRNTVTGKVYCFEPLAAKREDIQVFIKTKDGEKTIPKAAKPKSTGVNRKGPKTLGVGDSVIDFITQ